jgi:23S rRNA (guanine2445-N2)-methyltransferase / 23S rRNA (guanine2069-N7)-methyltransferase
MKFIATCSPGLEKLLSEELGEMESGPCIESLGALSFEGDWALAARILLGSRIASRVLLSVKEFSAKNAAMTYDQLRRIDWTLYLNPTRTFSVSVHGNPEASDMRHSFAPLKIKDAICDEIKKRGLDRPNVDRNDPDLRVEAFFNSGRCEISLDLAGIPLHRRGYRSGEAEAPLRENRSAALLRFAGFVGKGKFCDPFCGSGTLAIEAALIAQNKAPGLLRDLTSYAGYNVFEELAVCLREERERLKKLVIKKPDCELLASDLDEESLQEAMKHANTAGVQPIITFKIADARTATFTDTLIATNPPFGIRTKGEPSKVLSEFTRQLKHHSKGVTLAVILPQGELEKAVGFRSSKRISLENGPLKSRFLKYEIY